ncbi:hypothetical protein LB545_29880 [Mesorhizobium sp. BR1-1-6]|uniref:hypothetical protein n=1 Tax=Mesorhizobium sp. BR1-1-6 TaxID=2876648 RepID=UPI001CD0F9EF|nr:hypothetical protein [Mesorhizobium sp. BR1-1-6]MBZ9898525.1 hypothetical protein [Mesorhizobium sp. BR1-1-6]
MFEALGGSPAIIEIAKAILPPILTVTLAWLVGNRLTASWNLRQRQNEQAQARTDDFFRSYGELFSTWKAWNFLLDNKEETFALQKLELFKKSAASEGAMEALFVKLCAELVLDDSELARLGCLRQAYQSLRQAIRSGSKLDWGSSENPQYLAFKRLSISVASLLAIPRHTRETPTWIRARKQLETVTSNQWEAVWFKVE